MSPSKPGERRRSFRERPDGRKESISGSIHPQRNADIEYEHCTTLSGRTSAPSSQRVRAASSIHEVASYSPIGWMIMHTPTDHEPKASSYGKRMTRFLNHDANIITITDFVPLQKRTDDPSLLTLDQHSFFVSRIHHHELSSSIDRRFISSLVSQPSRSAWIGSSWL